MWRKIRNSHRKTQRTKINHMRIQKQLNQGEKNQVGGIDLHEPTIGGGYHETKIGTQFFQIKETKGERCTEEYYKAKVDTCFTKSLTVL